MSTVVYTNRDSPEDKQLLYNFKTVTYSYWTFNLFTQILQSLDCLCHLWITVHCLRHIDYQFSNLWVLFTSVVLNFLSIVIKSSVFGRINPFYFLINQFPGKYSKISRFRLVQLWYRYQDIVQGFFNKPRRSINSVKNSGYVNVKILSSLFIEDFGSPRLPFPGFAIHEIFESAPFCLFLFLYITYYDIHNALYTSSIVLSLLCISCQLFNFLATTNNIHYSMLAARFLCIVIDMFGAFAMLACLMLLYSSLVSAQSSWTWILGWIAYVFAMKFICTTVPISLALSWLFVLRSIGIMHNPHTQRSIVYVCLHVILVAVLILVVAMIASVLLEISVNFYWFGLTIHRLFNERFSHWDGNNNFWRRIIEWMLLDIEPIVKAKHSDPGIQHQLLHRFKTRDSVLRLFSINSNLCSRHEWKRFNDVSLRAWMDDVFKYIFYDYYYDEYEITERDFCTFSQTTLTGYKQIFAMIVSEQIAAYFEGHNRSTTNDVIQYMADFAERFNLVDNIITRQHLDTICEGMFQCVLYFALWIATPLYLLSRVFNVIFPLMIITMTNVMMLQSETCVQWTSLPMVLTMCYYASICMLIVAWFCNVDICGYGMQCGSDVAKLIFALCPSLYRPGELYVSSKYGYFTQYELFQRIVWHYERHRYAQIEGEIVINKFGKDIAREIFDYLPRSYEEEKISMGKLSMVSSSNAYEQDASGHYVLNPRLEVIFHALAGAFGMVLESTINHPLDTLKTRYQLICNIQTSQTPSITQLTSSMIRNEGILSVYRGLPMVLLMQAPRGFLKFGTNYSIQHVVHEHVSYIHNVHALNLLSGIGTGIIDGIIVSPFEFVKVRMQSSDYRQVYRNTFVALYDIVWKHPPLNNKWYGVLCMLNGMELTIWRNGLWHGVYFGSLGKQKEAADRFGQSKLNDFIFGCLGGAAGSVFSSPFDVAKSRLQNVNTQQMSNLSRNPWALRCVYNVYREEGFAALYRGFVPKLLRLGLGGGILMFSFEYSLLFIEMVHLFATRQV